MDDEKLTPATTRNRKAKLDALNAYGGKCFYCDETDFRLLTFCQKDNPAELKRRGPNLYMWLRAHGFPDIGAKLVCARHLYLARENAPDETPVCVCTCGNRFCASLRQAQKLA